MYEEKEEIEEIELTQEEIDCGIVNTFVRNVFTVYIDRYVLDDFPLQCSVEKLNEYYNDYSVVYSQNKSYNKNKYLVELYLKELNEMLSRRKK